MFKWLEMKPWHLGDYIPARALTSFPTKLVFFKIQYHFYTSIECTLQNPDFPENSNAVQMGSGSSLQEAVLELSDIVNAFLPAGVTWAQTHSACAQGVVQNRRTLSAKSQPVSQTPNFQSQTIKEET